MGTSRTNSRAAIALLLGLAGLCAAPPVAQAQQQPRLLFLGISKDGRAHQAAENAVKLRLAGLDVLVVQPKEIPDPPCERAECLAAALAAEHADFALSGRILKNDRACLATLWLVAGRNKGNASAAQDIVCRPDGKDSELAASLADGAATMIESYLQNSEPAPTQSTIRSSLAIDILPKTVLTTKKRWGWKRKLGLIGFSTSLALSLAGLGYYIPMDGKSTSETLACPDRMEITCQKIYSYGPQIALSASLAAASAVSLLIIATK